MSTTNTADALDLFLRMETDGNTLETFREKYGNFWETVSIEIENSGLSAED